MYFCKCKNGNNKITLNDFDNFIAKIVSERKKAHFKINERKYVEVN